jgi:hypothetical protein
MAKASWTSTVMISRDELPVSFAQAVTIDRLSGAATGQVPPFPYRLTPGHDYRCVLMDVRAKGERHPYVIYRNGDFSFNAR